MQVEISEYELCMRRRWEISRGAADAKRNAFVRMEDEGIVGEGEAAFHRLFGETPESVWADLERAAGALAGGDPRELRRLRLAGAARCAVEMALLDWQAKQEGKPLGESLGVPRAPEPVTTSFSIGIDRPETMAEKAAEAAGFHILKVKAGTPADQENMAAVRGATEARLRVDANGGWTSRDEAARMLEWLDTKIGVELVEQPLAPGRLEDTAWLRERSPIPIVLDEDVRVADDVAAVAEACDGINIKLMKTGGPHEAIRMAAEARAHGLRVMLGCMIESSLAIGAALHLAPLADWVDLDGHLLIADDPFEGIGLADGRLVVPEGPGIGVHRRTGT